MSAYYCQLCQTHVDLDYQAEHLTDNGFGVMECQEGEYVDTHTEFGEVFITSDGEVKTKGSHATKPFASTRVL